jgi:signal peptidase I
MKPCNTKDCKRKYSFRFILFDLIFALMMILGVALIVLKITKFQVFAVETPSMQELYPVGSIIITDSESPENLEVGDVISFVADEDLTVVTHRIVRIDTKNKKIYTKGDSNNTEDASPVPFDNVIGKVRFSVPYLGFVILKARTKVGRVILKCLLAAVLIFFFEEAVVALCKRIKASETKKTELALTGIKDSKEAENKKLLAATDIKSNEEADNKIMKS